jgi:lysozyme
MGKRSRVILIVGNSLNLNRDLEMKKRIIQLLIFALLISGIMAFLFYRGYLRLNYPSRKEFPIQGIDISHHQKNIDWEKLKSEGITFVFMKATEGGDFVDPDFKSNWEKAKKSGYTVGAYHFYRICKTGAEQFDNFMRSVPNDQNVLPPAIDLEFDGNCKTDKSKEQILKEIGEFIDKIKAYYGHAPILYATSGFYDAYLKRNFLDCPVWIRDINSRPALSDKRKWFFWQFANTGNLDGIDGFVDLNVFNGNKEAFGKLMKGN